MSKYRKIMAAFMTLILLTGSFPQYEYKFIPVKDNGSEQFTSSGDINLLVTGS